MVLRRVTPPVPLSVVLVVLVVFAGAVGGCSAEPTSPASPGTHTAHGAEALPTPPAAADWNLADATYLTAMLAHHRQAIEMAALARVRASSPRVLRLAEAIGDAQGREILVMAGWLADRDLPVPTLAEVQAMGPMTEHGMISAEQMDELTAASGPAFDRLFLTDMIAHHEGAIAMAEEQLAAGKHVLVGEWAAEVIASQGAEIRRMRRMLKAQAALR